MADFQKVVHRVDPSRIFKRILYRHTVVVRSDTSARRGLQMQRKREEVETEQMAGDDRAGAEPPLMVGCVALFLCLGHFAVDSHLSDS